MKTHELKTLSAPFQAVYEGRKTHELRQDDRGYEAGHLLILREYHPDHGYSDRCLLVLVTHITRNCPGLLPAHVVMSILRLAQGDLAEMRSRAVPSDFFSDDSTFDQASPEEQLTERLHYAERYARTNWHALQASVGCRVWLRLKQDPHAWYPATIDAVEPKKCLVRLAVEFHAGPRNIFPGVTGEIFKLLGEAGGLRMWVCYGAMPPTEAPLHPHPNYEPPPA